MPRVNSSLLYLGIDPGASGGLALVSSTAPVIASAMPNTETDVYDWIVAARGETFAVIEQVTGYVGDAGNPGSAMFKFGCGYGGLRMALVACGIPFEAIAPRTWQKGLGISPRDKSESKGAWKNRLKAAAQRLFPTLSVTLSTADALLIAEFCRRKREGKL